MSDTTMLQQLTFLAEQRQADESTILADAMRQGLQTLYHEALIEGCLNDQVSRDTLTNELGMERVIEIDYQRDALQRDIAWGLQDA